MCTACTLMGFFKAVVEAMVRGDDGIAIVFGQLENLQRRLAQLVAKPCLPSLKLPPSHAIP